MPQSEPIDFYFSIGSMFTFLTVMRMDRVEDMTDIRFVWRPFSVRTIMIEMDNRPAVQAEKLAYMWRDLHRRAEMYGFAFEGEAPYPLKEFDRANRVAVVGAREGGAPTMCARPTGAGSSRSRNAAMEPNLSDSLREIGEDPRARARARAAEETTRAYEAATDEARRWASSARRAS